MGYVIKTAAKNAAGNKNYTSSPIFIKGVIKDGIYFLMKTTSRMIIIAHILKSINRNFVIFDDIY